MRFQLSKTSWYVLAILCGSIWTAAVSAAASGGIYPQPGVYGFSTGEDRVRAQGTMTIAPDLSTTASLYFTYPVTGLQRRIDATIRFLDMKPNGTGVMAATFPDGSVHSVLYAISEGGTKFSFATRDVNGLPPGGTLAYVITGTARRQLSAQPQPGTYAGSLRNANMSLVGVATVLPDGSTRVSRKIFTGGIGIISDLDDIVCTVTVQNPDGTGIYGCQVDGRIDSVFYSFGGNELYFTLISVGGVPSPGFVLSGGFTRQ